MPLQSPLTEMCGPHVLFCMYLLIQENKKTLKDIYNFYFSPRFPIINDIMVSDFVNIFLVKIKK